MSVTAAAVVAALARRFRAPEFVFLTEVQAGTGHERRRRTDAVAVSLWPSRGLHLVGCEIKVTRGDWLRERRQPEKPDQMFRFCRHWYLVTVPGVVRDDGEIPSTWGHLELVGRRLMTRRRAPELEPDAPDWLLVAALTRKAVDGMVPGSAVDELVERRLESEREQIADLAARRSRNAGRRLEVLEERLAAFEQATGVDLDRAISPDHARRIGKAVAVLSGESPPVWHRARLRDAEQVLERAAQQVQAARLELEALESVEGGVTTVRVVERPDGTVDELPIPSQET